MNEKQELFYIEIRKYSTGMINLNSNESDPAVIAATLKSVIEKIEEQYTKPIILTDANEPEAK